MIRPDRNRSIEELEGIRWPDPAADSTSLVKAVHALRKRPLDSLSAYELGRLVGQDVGIRWTLPLALEILHRTASTSGAGDFYDDDLLSAALTRKEETWASFPELAATMKEVIDLLDDVSPYIQDEIDQFSSIYEKLS